MENVDFNEFDELRNTVDRLQIEFAYNTAQTNALLLYNQQLASILCNKNDFVDLQRNYYQNVLDHSTALLQASDAYYHPNLAQHTLFDIFEMVKQKLKDLEQ